MPKVIEGLDETLDALKNYYPALYKELNAEIRPVMKGLVMESRALIPNEIAGLSSWKYKRQKGEKQSQTSRARAFPTYDASVARKGITFTLGLAKRNANGWVNAYTLFNRSAVGAILETAGRKNPNGDPRSQSRNPKAGAHFIKSIQEQNALYRVGTSLKSRGRIIFQAVNKNEGKAAHAIEAAVNKASAKAQRKVDAA